MENDHVKVKIGDFEIDTTGDPAVVQSRLDTFKDLVALALSHQTPTPPPSTQATITPTPPVPPAPFTEPENGVRALADVEAQLGKIMKWDGRIVSLTVQAQTVDDAALLMLLGQKVLRGNESVNGFEVISGLTQTGLSVDRVDRVMKKAATDGTVISVGQRRARRYRLSNTGLARAKQIASELIATVA